MSILIKDMEMPKSCNDCEFIQRGYPDWCDLSCRSRDVFNPSIRPDWCPLEEAEPKHGRWETLENGHDAVCSNCHKYWIPTEDKYDYWFCPRCGAKMDEVKE